jgi:putative heme-binding domain-containing protein
MTGGMDNPVGLVFTPGGERIITTTFLQHPGGGRRDGLLHAVYGGIYGKDHEPIYEHPWTGPDLMPVMTHLGAAAPCGLVRYESSVFGKEYKDNLFACLFNMHKVTRHVLMPDGATFKTRDEDFLASDNLDFHPTDVLEDVDGSLLVIDTGGWYKLCCPTSQLHKPDILGSIYRVKRKDAPRVEDPRGLSLAWSKMPPDQLASLLSDLRPAVRRRAVQALADRGHTTLPALKAVLHSSDSPVEARLNAVWAATRIEGMEARAVVREALRDPDGTVRQAAIHSISVCRDVQASEDFLIQLLTTSLLHALDRVEPKDAQNARAVAEALGRVGDRQAVIGLLAALQKPCDRVLEHSLIYALIEIGDRAGTEAALIHPDGDTRRSVLEHAAGNTRRALLIALDQMRNGKLDAKSVADELTSKDASMRVTAWWIASRHPEWGGTLAGYLRDRLGSKDLKPAEEDELVGFLAKFARAASIQDLLAERIQDVATPGEARRIILRAMAQSNLKEAPSPWIAPITAILTSKDIDLVRQALSTVRSLRLPGKGAEGLPSALLKIGNTSSVPADVRLNALAAVPGELTQVEPSLFSFLLSQVGTEQPLSVRGAAADVLSHAKLSTEQLGSLTESVKTVGPIEIDRLLEPFAHCSDDAVGQRLLAALKVSAARSSLRGEMIKPRLAKFSATIQKQAEELYALLDVDAAKQRARLEQMLTSLKDGDVRRGQAVFNSTKAACAACHAIGYLGGNVGPDLTHIGKIRGERDLLESIVFPSASFVRSYEPVVVSTKDGRFINGLIRKDASDEILLATGVNQEARIARKDIEEILPSRVSIMPAGLDQQLSVRELSDLVAFLKACK